MSFKTGKRKDGSSFKYPISGRGNDEYLPRSLEVRKSESIAPPCQKCGSRNWYYEDNKHICSVCGTTLDGTEWYNLKTSGVPLAYGWDGNLYEKKQDERQKIADALGIPRSEVNDDVVADWRRAYANPDHNVSFDSQGAEEYYDQLVVDGYSKDQAIAEVKSCFGNDSIREGY